MNMAKQQGKIFLLSMSQVHAIFSFCYLFLNVCNDIN
jgi:hypothetical protein